MSSSRIRSRRKREHRSRIDPPDFNGLSEAPEQFPWDHHSTHPDRQAAEIEIERIKDTSPEYDARVVDGGRTFVVEWKPRP